MIIVATLPESSQHIVIEEGVLVYIAQYRQLSWYSREAGGQIFGAIDAKKAVISAASGPYRGDDRWRSSYRSNPKAAQLAIDQHAKNGLLYLGEWHTHPEGHPNASVADLDAMRRLRNASETRSSALLMLIQGQADGVHGCALYSLGPDGLNRWMISQQHSVEEH